MSESDPIDLSQLQGLQFGPTWADKLAASESAPGEVTWGRAPDSRTSRDERAPRRDRDGRPGGRGDGRGPGGGGERRGDSRGPRPEFRGGPGGERRNDGPPRGERRDGPRPVGGGDNRGPRPAGGGDNRGPRPEFRSGPGGERREGPPRGGPRSGGERREFGGRPRGDESGRFERDRREGPPPPLAGWQAKLMPEPRSVEVIAKQIKVSGRAFSVFDVGRLFMSSRERYVVQFSREKSRPAPTPGPQSLPPQARPAAAAPQATLGPELIYQCVADHSLWLSREEANRHILNSPAITKYYRTEAVTVDAPKGNWSAVAVCGFSGALLGPPNHHDFQRNVARLHRERFSDMPLERYKSRIRTEKDEALLSKWQDSQTSTTHFVQVTADALPEGEEPPTPLKSQAEMEAHFLRTHADTAVKEVNTATVPGNIPGKCLTPPLFSLLRREVEQQQRFPMGLVQDLCRELEGRGLRFFKRDKKATFVVRTRPHFLPDDLVLSERIRRIVEMVRANPGISYTRLVGTLAPHIEVTPSVTQTREAEATPAAGTPAEAPPPAGEAVAPATEEPVPAAQESSATAYAPASAEAPSEPAPAEAEPVVAETEAAEAPFKASEETPVESATTVPTEAEATTEELAAPPPVVVPEAPPLPILTPEEIVILQDLRWLVNEGYVTEFAAGELFVLGRPPQPAPEKRERLPRQKPAAPAKEVAADAAAPESGGEPGPAAAEATAELGEASIVGEDDSPPAAVTQERAPALAPGQAQEPPAAADPVAPAED